MTVYARNRRRMWTAFSHAGGALLNIADNALPGRVASIRIPEERLTTFLSGSDREIDALVEDLFRDGERLRVPVQTPSVSSDLRLAA